MHGIEVFSDRPVHSGRKTGFTLIEMSVVLVVIGLVIGTIVPLLISQIRQEKIREVREVVRIARDEIVGFARMNKRLPTRSEFSSQIGHTIDPWNEELFYLPAEGMTSPDNLCDDIDSIAGLSIEVPGRDQDVLRAGFIVGSKGANYQSNTYLGATLIRSYNQGDGLSNEGTEGTVIVKSYGENDQEDNKYDDIVEFVTLYYLDSRVCP
ncbi:prepilin-type N-terminal cleavage/methylation domain-containing protein [Desulfonatronospira sp.]|uniref:prepilin-type N-terminal cleavage/methylation domain-containing protein n=1 Tax=Desulfonatronospira sp. TaxID=1962951 RepID=UPI0025C122FD|nr:prepilin-type N-terminal cleavage/methylation domain-containing protein [Desulfonatronospira sp.]